jgi:hypothetical protein
MVPKLFRSGKSFKKCAAYLLHDAEKALTSGRVPWTHTLNLASASDTPSLAVNEMLWTARAADELKRAAGARNGGRPLDDPVRHFSLNWHPSENPSRDDMIKTVQSYLKHMKWHEHQALIVCHDDKEHPHVHVMLNAVHPETGRALNSSFEKRRTQQWAKDYEREHGQVFCEERLKPAAERTPSPTRQSWEKLRKFERDDDLVQLACLTSDLQEARHGNPKRLKAREWAILKQEQREERVEWFANGKDWFREAHKYAYREIREEFRSEWRDFYTAKKNGMDRDELATMKADILERQGKALEEKSLEYRTNLRAYRDEQYNVLKIRQQADRERLTERQRKGLRSYGMLDEIAAVNEPAHEFWIRAPAAKVSEVKPEERKGTEKSTQIELPAQIGPPGQSRKANPRSELMSGLGLGAISLIATIGERLFDGFLGGGEATTPPPAKEERAEPESETENVRQAAPDPGPATGQEREAAALKEWWDERRKRSRERD